MALSSSALCGTCDKLIDMESLYKTTHKKLKNYIRKYIDNESDIDDIVQETYLVAIVKEDTYQGNSRVDVWLFGIAKHLAFNLIKKSKRRGQHLSEDVTLESEQDDVASEMPVERNPVDVYESINTLEAVSKEIAKLPKNMSKIYLDVVLDERSYKCVANQYAIPVGTVRSNVARARQHVRDRVALRA